MSEMLFVQDFFRDKNGKATEKTDHLDIFDYVIKSLIIFSFVIHLILIHTTGGPFYF
jgi:hypothetical protein